MKDPAQVMVTRSLLLGRTRSPGTVILFPWRGLLARSQVVSRQSNALRL